MDSGKIVFDEGVLSYLKNLYVGYWREGDRLHKTLLVSLILSLVAALGSIFLLSALSPAFYLIMVISFPSGLLLVILFNQIFTNFTSEDEIEVDDVHFARVNEGRKFLRRPKITLIYEEDREDKKRSINLPSLLMPSSEEILEDGKELLRDHGIKVK